MKVLVTGSEGMIGAAVRQTLETRGHQVVRYDLVSGHDILNAHQLDSAIQGCDAVIHLAASLGEDASSHDVMAINLSGTWNVLAAAEKASLRRVVFFSSMEVTGVFRGERQPDYLPLDDAHPCFPVSPYAISKLLAEQMCRWFSFRSGIATICLRLPGVFDASTYDFIIAQRITDPAFEWTPFWQYGAFLDVRDAAEAALRALLCHDPGHIVLSLCADDISSATQTSRELVQLLCPRVPWRGGCEYEREPFKSLIDTRRAKTILNWSPRHQWRA